MFLWPESEMSVGVSFYVMGSGVLWVRPWRNCWNRSALDCWSHPEGYTCNLIAPTISTLSARRQCKSEQLYCMIRAIVIFLDFNECVWFVRWESWLSCWLGRRESWMGSFTTVQPSEAAKWRMCVRISSVMDTTTRAKTTSPQESLGNKKIVSHPFKTQLRFSSQYCSAFSKAYHFS